MPSEARASTTINQLWEAAGWRFLPDVSGQRENIVYEQRVSKKSSRPISIAERTSNMCRVGLWITCC
jgi:hypothetical protein